MARFTTQLQVMTNQSTAENNAFNKDNPSNNYLLLCTDCNQPFLLMPNYNVA